jgi:ABC-type uncharacterized transport system ATPase subunit
LTELLRRARRVLAVQSKLDRLAQWGLVDLQAQSAALTNQQRSLRRFMSEGSDFAGTFSSAVMRQLQALAENLAMLANGEEMQQGRLLDERRRQRCAEKICVNFEYEARRKDTLRQLSEVIESAQQRRT